MPHDARIESNALDLSRCGEENKGRKIKCLGRRTGDFKGICKTGGLMDIPATEETGGYQEIQAGIFIWPVIGLALWFIAYYLW